MNVLVHEGILDSGLILPEGGVQLPDKARVYVIAPELAPKRVAHVYMPAVGSSGTGQRLRQNQ